MAITEIPPVSGVDPESGEELHSVPVLLIQLQDDLTRSRLREAFWISVVFHLLLVIAIVAAPKYLPTRRVVVLNTAEDMLRQQELNYLELPPDAQKVTQRPKTNNVSDKDRIATSRTPQIDRKALDELRGRPGAPGAPGRPAPQMASPAPPPQSGQQAQGPPAPPPVRPQANSDSTTTAQLQPPPQPRAFGSMTSPGAAIEQAARAAAISRGGGGGGDSGDYGLGRGRGQGTVRDQYEVLSDTMGVDFGPYLQRVLHDVRENWYQLIPEVARAPLMMRGRVSIEFAITKNGQVAGMRLVGPSGDVSLDRAAWGGITASNPFSPLPAEFRGSYLALRFHFFYNPDRHDLE